MSYLELKNVDKYYGDVHAIKGVNLTINKGEFIVFVGPSGCGKSTLLRMIAGLEEINDGDLVLDGNEITDLAPSKRDLAMVFRIAWAKAIGGAISKPGTGVETTEI